jgi:hypothetical protein
METTMNERSQAWSRIALWLAGATWLVAVGGGFVALWAYKTTPGVAAAAPATWPTESRIERARDGATLVMFAHPRCSCTRASLHELEALLARVSHPPRVVVAFTLPGGVGDDWMETELWRSAEAIPGAQVFADRGGREAAMFASRTSGTALVFSGGITSLRDHEGDSAGQERIVALLTGHAPDKATSPVFGCELDETKDIQTKEIQR